MKTKHTKGEWTSVPDDGTGNILIKTESVFVCKIFSNGFEEPNGLEAMQNAKLIASAPELLEALKLYQIASKSKNKNAINAQMAHASSFAKDIIKKATDGGL